MGWQLHVQYCVLIHHISILFNFSVPVALGSGLLCQAAPLETISRHTFQSVEVHLRTTSHGDTASWDFRVCVCLCVVFGVWVSLCVCLFHQFNVHSKKIKYIQKNTCARKHR